MIEIDDFGRIGFRCPVCGRAFSRSHKCRKAPSEWRVDRAPDGLTRITFTARKIGVY